MARPDITFIKEQGQSGRTIPGQDYVSAFLFYTGTLPSGFSSSNRIQQFLSLADAEAAGIAGDYSDATAATATWDITTAGAAGNVVTVKVNDLDATGNPQVTTLGSYTVVTGDTASTIATALVAAITANTSTIGYSAVNTGADITITAPRKFGAYLNSGTPVVITSTGGSTQTAGTLTQFSGGVTSLQAVWHYHIQEFFRMQTGSNGTDGLFVGFFAVPSPYTFSEITLMQNFAQGAIRQIGVYKDGSAYTTADLSAIDTEIKTNDDARHKPLSALYAGNLFAVEDISTIADLTSLTANKASSIIAQDGAYLGNFLFKTCGKSITTLGAALGALSLSAVSEDFGQPISKFNLSAGGGLECDVPAFANGVLLSNTSVSDALLDSLDSKRHIFLQKYVGTPGAYFNDNHAAIATSSDYAYINDNRVIDKATRGIYASMLPALKGRLLLNSDGTLATTTVSYLQNLALAPLYQMNRDGDLSDVATGDVYINPAQNVQSTSVVVVNVSLNEDGIARQIQIPIGFK